MQRMSDDDDDDGGGGRTELSQGCKTATEQLHKAEQQ